MEIRPYIPEDYSALKRLYEKAGWFDVLVDSEEILNIQIKNAPNSILVAISENKVIGSVTLLATGRLALFFRLVYTDKIVIKPLLEKGEKFFVDKGYKRFDIVAPEQDLVRHKEYLNAGFNKGDGYRWFWKERV